MIGLGGFALAFAVDGVQKGEVKLQNSLIQRGRQKYLFWSTIGVVVFAGVVVLCAVIWLMFFKRSRDVVERKLTILTGHAVLDLLRELGHSPVDGEIVGGLSVKAAVAKADNDDIGAGTHQLLRDVGAIVDDRQHKRAQSIFGGHIHVRPMGQQNGHDIVVIMEGGQHQSRLVVFVQTIHIDAVGD